jgi:hypothetical protein
LAYRLYPCANFCRHQVKPWLVEIVFLGWLCFIGA